MAGTTNSGKRALATGGAGLIGSHVTGLLVREGWTVRVCDNLEPQTHRAGDHGEFRPGEMLHLTNGTARIREGVGYLPLTDLLTGVGRYLQWIRQQGNVKDDFTEATQRLKTKGIIHRAAR